jgi:anhydro-N-acetylmuramic acid kinase
MLAHTSFGTWMGHAIEQFIDKNSLHHKIHLIASHGHTVFHEPNKHMTFQLGDGAAIAAINKLPVVSDLRNMDIALSGQGAPIVPIGEKLFWNEYAYFLNIGGISNITINKNGEHIAFDVCPANRVLNLLCSEIGKTFDEGGKEAATGNINYDLLDELNDLPYYKQSFPKSLSNEYGVDTVFSLIQKYSISTQDKLNTYCEHIAMQISDVCHNVTSDVNDKMLVTGGGAFNTFLIEKIQHHLMIKRIDVDMPDADLIEYKEALIMALIGVLRWREEINVLSSVTGASRNSVGGALWMGQE